MQVIQTFIQPLGNIMKTDIMGFYKVPSDLQRIILTAYFHLSPS